MLKVIAKNEFEQRNNRFVIREGSKQVLLLKIDGTFFAIDNRCPHEGYPLSEGSADAKSCVLTCNWHNWKFDLSSGKCLIGGDNVRTYKVFESDDSISVDLSEPSIEETRDQIMEGLEVAFRKQQHGRISRELSRLHFNKIDPLYAVKKSIEWSYERFEFGMTHAYAALADWLALYNQTNDLTEKMICLTETIDHMAFDSLRHLTYPYSKNEKDHSSFNDTDLLDAIEKEDHKRAESLINKAFDQGMRIKDLDYVFSRAALDHYNDFGHGLIYVQKCLEISSYLNDQEVERYLALSLVRSLCYATREDLIPEFKNYGKTLTQVKENSLQSKSGNKTELGVVGVNKSYEWLIDHSLMLSAQELYREALKMNASHFLYFDLRVQGATDNPVNRNVGWLDFTHAITFSNAVRITCEKYPDLWPSGLVQIMSFYGRNSAFTDREFDVSPWLIEDKKEFKNLVLKTIYDHGLGAPIFSSHVLKTGVAILDEIKNTDDECAQLLMSAFNRFLHSPLKQKHVRRMVTQGIKLVEKDFSIIHFGK